MSIRPIYDVNNEDWLAPKSNLTDAEAFDAIVSLYQIVTPEQYTVAMADLANAGLPAEEVGDA
jgi:hypothetical protein